MKRYKFRLQKVLNYREQQKKERKNALGMRIRELLEAREQEEVITKAHDEERKEEEKITTMAEMSMVGNYKARLRRQLKEQQEEVKKAEIRADEAREIYLLSAIDVGALQSIKDKRKAEHQYKQKREEKKVNDELVINKFNRRSR